jgi:hypothetical protein
MKRQRALLALCVVAVGAAGCGGGGGRLSKDAYRSKLAKISQQVDAAHAAVGRDAPKARRVAQVQTVLRRFAAAESRVGDEVSALKAPKDAETANTELARGEHDDAAEIRALLPKLSKFKSVQQAFGFLQQIGHTKGGQEEDQAVAQLRKLGYTKGS